MPIVQFTEERKMDAEQINKRIHEWLGKCWHDIQEFIEGYKTGRKCIRCNKSFTLISWKSPDYTTDLNAVREAELKCIEEFGDEAYMTALIEAQEDCEVEGWSGSKLFLVLIITPADKRAQAVCDVLEVQGK